MYYSKPVSCLILFFLFTLSILTQAEEASSLGFALAMQGEFHAPVPDRPGYRPENTGKKYQQVRFGERTYYYRDGLFFRLHGGRYITVDPPLGARVGGVPRTAIRLDLGPHRYFRLGLTWYLFHDDGNYEVVEDPREQNEQVAEEEKSDYEQQKVNLAIYAGEGQSEDQLDRDRYECHLWANKQSGFDPTLPNQDLDQRDFYIRAMTACLEGRGYTVR